MSARRARRLSSALFVLLGSGLCTTAARASDAADVARLVAEPALQLAVSPAGQRATSARARRTSRPASGRQAPGKAQRRPQRSGATTQSPGQPPGSSQQGMPNPSLRS